MSFKVVATSFYAERPEKSMALIVDPGDPDNGRWVKEGAQIGHFVVHEIRRGAVVLRDGERLEELVVERRPTKRSLVRDVRPAREVSAAIFDSNEIRE